MPRINLLTTPERMTPLRRAREVLASGVVTPADHNLARRLDFTRAENTDKATFLASLFPPGKYTAAWRADPLNKVLMEAYSQFIVGHFPKLNDLETDAMRLRRAHNAGRLFQQKYPLPKNFDLASLRDPAHADLRDQVFVAMLVSIWAWHKKHGRPPNSVVEDSRFPVRNYMQDVQPKVDMFTLCLLMRVHARGFGGFKFFGRHKSRWRTIETQYPNTYKRGIAFAGYIIEHYNFNTPGRTIDIKSVENFNVHESGWRHLRGKLSSSVWSTEYIKTPGHAGIEANLTEVVVGGLFYKNFLLWDALVPGFRKKYTRTSRRPAMDWCDATNRHLTDEQKASSFPGPNIIRNEMLWSNGGNALFIPEDIEEDDETMSDDE